MSITLKDGSSLTDRHTLLTRLHDAVKQCQVRFGGRTELATDSDSRVSCLCSAWEAVFQHGLKHNKALSAFKQVTEITRLSKVTANFDAEPEFWLLIKELLSPHEMLRYVHLRHITTDTGRARAWLRASINEHLLERHIYNLLDNQKLLSQVYEDWAFLRDEELNSVLPIMAAGLGSILFAITIDKHELNSPRHPSFPHPRIPSTVCKEPLPVISYDIHAQSYVKGKQRKKKKKDSNVISFNDEDDTNCVVNDEYARSTSESGAWEIDEERSTSESGAREIDEERSTSESGVRLIDEECSTSESGVRLIDEECSTSESGARLIIEECPTSESGARLIGEARPIRESRARLIDEECPTSKSEARLIGAARSSSESAARLMDNPQHNNEAGTRLIDDASLSGKTETELTDNVHPEQLGTSHTACLSRDTRDVLMSDSPIVLSSSHVLSTVSPNPTLYPAAVTMGTGILKSPLICENDLQSVHDRITNVSTAEQDTSMLDSHITIDSGSSDRRGSVDTKESPIIKGISVKNSADNVINKHISINTDNINSCMVIGEVFDGVRRSTGGGHSLAVTIQVGCRANVEGSTAERGRSNSEDSIGEGGGVNLEGSIGEDDGASWEGCTAEGRRANSEDSKGDGGRVNLEGSTGDAGIANSECTTEKGGGGNLKFSILDEYSRDSLTKNNSTEALSESIRNGSVFDNGLNEPIPLRQPFGQRPADTPITFIECGDIYQTSSQLKFEQKRDRTRFKNLDGSLHNSLPDICNITESNEYSITMTEFTADPESASLGTSTSSGLPCSYDSGDIFLPVNDLSDCTGFCLEADRFRNKLSKSRTGVPNYEGLEVASANLGVVHAQTGYNRLFSSENCSPNKVLDILDTLDKAMPPDVKQALITIMLRKDEVENQNRNLSLKIMDEGHLIRQLTAQLEELNNTVASLHEKHESKLKTLEKENELLKHQLRKYVSAVQILRREKASSDEEIGSALLDEPSVPPPPSNVDYNHEAIAYQSKLIEVAQMHAELSEFNDYLQKLLLSKDRLISSLKQDLIQLRGPLPEMPSSEDEIFSDTHGIQPASHAPVNIWIPSVFLRGKPSHAHHVYQVYIRVNDDEWNIYRRYREFYTFYNALRQTYPIIGAFEFPVKKIIRNKDALLVESRRIALQKFLRCSINHILKKNFKLFHTVSREALVAIVPFFRNGDTLPKTLPSDTQSDQSHTLASTSSHDYMGL